MTVWAGRILMFQGVLHLVVTLVASQRHFPSWLRGDLWFPPFGMGDLSATGGAFWLTLGSFGVPLVILGSVVAWLGRSDRSVPAFLGWALGIWGLAASAVFQPSPFITLLIPAALLILASRRAAAQSVRARGRGTDRLAQEA